MQFLCRFCQRDMSVGIRGIAPNTSSPCSSTLRNRCCCVPNAVYLSAAFNESRTKRLNIPVEAFCVMSRVWR